MSIVLSGITKRFGVFTAVDHVDLTIAPGELVALLGPSGSGKTTLLRIMGGLDFADSGQLLIDGQDATATEPHARRVGFVFQHYALFRHMTVFENVAFGLRVARRRPKLAEAEIRRRVLELLDLVQLAQLADRYPNQLSGGQRQRVALARALATEPRVLLLDEPFGALDAKVRKELRRWLREIHKGMGVITVFVTHDQEEALELADRVAILHRGRLEQVGTPAEIYDRPATAFVCDFLGGGTRLACTIQGDHAEIAGLSLALPAGAWTRGPGIAFVRPHDVEVLPAAGPGSLSARVRAVQPVGPELRLDLDLDGQVMEALLDRRTADAGALTPGAAVGVRLRHVNIFPA
ncbi:sulfate/molybdate ABC transporter ATP-binding protein [Rhodospirillum centenum]|uniref:Sulfate ABC transporter, ATP-binding protein n=1 Tax=Rhodospirillum centenum (strain ATCC 51521 / SW) TaxID=414684 RepID=B6IY36_RHOCS|nr:TOBE-like domain-containing protein [Rhodospirillum centenum]ACJ01210.1 sulfate ABC transporter, ATP-binding protein [Rhodospirillum centenum SW]